MSVYPLFDFYQPERNEKGGEIFGFFSTGYKVRGEANLPLVLLPDVILLREIHQVDHGLGRQEQVFVQNLNLWRKHRRIKR